MPGCFAINRPRFLAAIAIAIGSGIPRAEAQPSLLRADSILLERTGCFGFCPQYQVRMAKSGEILVRSGVRVRTESGADIFQTSGPAQRRSVRPDDFLHLMTIAAFLHFLELPDVIEDDIRFCAHRMTDHPSAIVTIFFGRQSKRVDDYLGCDWAPAGLRRLEAEIDSTAGTRTPLCPECQQPPIDGTYEIVLCKPGPCSTKDAARAVLRGVLVLFAKRLPPTPDSAAPIRSAFYGPQKFNACFVLDSVGAGLTYAGINRVGATHWMADSDEPRNLTFSLFRSPDAGHDVTGVLANGEFAGRGQSWGAGTAGFAGLPDTVVASRVGDADMAPCIAASARERRRHAR